MLQVNHFSDAHRDNCASRVLHARALRCGHTVSSGLVKSVADLLPRRLSLPERQVEPQPVPLISACLPFAHPSLTLSICRARAGMPALFPAPECLSDFGCFPLPPVNSFDVSHV